MRFDLQWMKLQLVKMGQSSQRRDLCSLIGGRFSYRSTYGTWRKSDKGKTRNSYGHIRGPVMHLKQCSYQRQPGGLHFVFKR